METDSPSKTFFGVSFVLFGLDSVNDPKVRSMLLSGGGVDAGQCIQSCTHVIVDKIVYDDPVCIAARNEGKTLVTRLWVDHSFDIGMAVDTTAILYRPLRDLNGIPGSKGLIVCLTGYQRQDRDDIMTMVGLMGAQFSKPLVANKVTHLICYKFEGEKYELANRLKKIKLVNHHWLEDCLREWQLLPEENYHKSGYELEIKEAEAKDSEEDAEDSPVKQSGYRNAIRSPHNLKTGTPKALELLKSTEVVANLSGAEGLCGILNDKHMLLSSGKEKETDLTSGFDGIGVSDVPGLPKSQSIFKDTASTELPDPKQATPNATIVGNTLESTSRSAEKPPNSDAKLSAISYKRKTTSPSSIFSKALSYPGGSPKESLCKSINISPAKVEYAKDIIGSGHTGIPRTEKELLQEETSSSKKQKTDVSRSSATFDNCLFCGNDDLSVDVSNPNAAQNSHADVSTAKSSRSMQMSSTKDLPFVENGTLETGLNANYNSTLKAPLSGCIGSNLVGEPGNESFGGGKATKAEEPQNQQQAKQFQSPSNAKLETEKPHTIANFDMLEGANSNTMAKQAGKRTAAKKTLGSRPKLRNTAYQKGSIYFNNTAAQKDPAGGLSGQEKQADHEKTSYVNERATSPTIANVTAVAVRTEKATKSGDHIENKADFMDDEIEAPEENDGNKDAFNEKKAQVFDNKIESKSEGAHHETSNCADDMHSGAKGGNNSTEPRKKDKSTSKVDGEKLKSSKGKRRPLSKVTTKAVSDVFEQKQSEKALDGMETNDCENAIEKDMEKEGMPCTADQTKSRTASCKKSKSAMRVGKENQPFANEGQNISQAKQLVGETSVEFEKAPLKINHVAGKSSSSLTASKVSNQLKTEPAVFILSGHRLQRKEFQQVIRHLKGKFCRDSHQWSYQATHFIAPDPVRRTEKFFAAAASGRWILRTDYITGCSQAGKFLAEEPYEWHKNGLSEDGAINLEAPRKWRLLREKTGHGAFYGMHIVIYGECIAPPLDTLKRVVKAGDGTIVATSPPYTRFLTSGIDYAIVSPGMPRVDIWVQEFLKHEIPCVSADYLVEYICKPGYPLEKHVLYNTHGWAEKSFARLSSRAEEIVEGIMTPSDDCSSKDRACQVCGTGDRGEVMLICGDESGSVGCGVGMHIDCCDPPLEQIPEEDWFCPKCSGSTSRSNKIHNKQKRRKTK